VFIGARLSCICQKNRDRNLIAKLILVCSWVIVKEFGYILCDPDKRKIVTSRDVVFHKHETITDIDSSRKSTQHPTSVAVVTSISISFRGATDGGAMVETGARSTIALALYHTLANDGLDKESNHVELLQFL